MVNFSKRTVKAVIFDNDGILSLKPPRVYHKIVRLLKDHGWKGDAEYFRGRWVEARRPAFIRIEPQIETVKRFFANEGLPYEQPLLDEFLALRKEMQQSRILLPGVKDVVRGLRRRGIAVAVFTDSSKSGKDRKRFFAENGVHFDHVFSSADLGMSKRQASSFKLVLKRLGLKPREAVFVGHSDYEIASSMKAGIFTVSKSASVKGDRNISRLTDVLRVVDSLMRHRA